MKRYISVAALFAVMLPVAAQNLNPTVEVTNAFQGRTIEVDKPLGEMYVPDTLMRFDLNFDYSVFEQRYAGADDFAPYLMDMRPDAQKVGGRRAFVRAGAGYTMHPTLDVVFSPEMRKGELNIYGTHRSYFGQYRNIAPEGLELQWDGTTVDGFVSKTEAGLNGRVNVGKASEISYQAEYDGRFMNHGLTNHAYLNSLDTKFRMKSQESRTRHFMYDFGFNARIGAEKFGTQVRDDLRLTAVKGFVFGTFGQVTGKGSSYLLDIKADINTYDYIASRLIGLSATPHYDWSNGRLNVSLGVTVSAVSAADDSHLGLYVQNVDKSKSQFVYPALYLDYNLIPDNLNLHASVTGGDRINGLYELKDWNPMLVREVSVRRPMYENTIERVNAKVGLRGNIASRFRFDLSGGYAMYANGLMDALMVADATYWYNTDYVMPGVAYRDYSLIYADLRMAVDAKPVLIDAELNYRGTSFADDKLQTFAPAPLSGYLRARYNWNDRIVAGVYGQFATERESWGTAPEKLVGVVIPGFLNLGIEAEYALTKKFSLWFRADNLLNRTIQLHPGIAENGISITGGLILNI